MDNVIIKDKMLKNNITYYNCSIPKEFENEMWLVKRFLVLRMNQLNVSITSDVLKDLIEMPNFIDQLYIWDCFISESINLNLNGEFIKTEMFKEHVATIKKSIDKYNHAKLSVKAKFYFVLLRGIFLIEDEDVKKIISSIPENIVKLPEIEAFKLQLSVKEGNVDSDTIINFVLSSKQYWVLLNYCESLKNAQEALNIMNQIKWLWGQSYGVLDYVIDLIRNLQGKKDAFDLLKGYEDTYSNTALFWVKAYNLAEIRNDQIWAIDSIISKANNNELMYSNTMLECELIKILINVI